MAMLGRDEAELRALGALWTAREIAQQPAMLRKTHAAAGRAARTRWRRFLRPLLESRRIARHPDRRRHLGLHRRMPGARISPHSCRAASRRSPRPTRLRAASLSASGHADAARFVRALRQQPGERRCASTCGAARRRRPSPGRSPAMRRRAARKHAQPRNAHGVLLPEETHDRGFAMTSSFSCMMYAALAALSRHRAACRPRVERDGAGGRSRDRRRKRAR